MICPGLVSVTFKNESPEFVLDAMRRAGLYAVEWSENWHVPAADPAAAAELAAKTRAQGAVVAAYGSYYRLGMNPNPEKAFRPVLKNAVAMSVPILRIWGGGRPSADLSAAERAAMAAEAALVSHMAANAGIKIALEWHRNTVTDTNESALRLLEEADAENLYCLWQPTPALNIPQRCAGIAQLEQQKKLLNLHVYYWRGEERRPLIEGAAEWTQYLDRVNRAEPRYALLEFVRGDTMQQLTDDADSLRRLLKDKGLLAAGTLR